MKQLSYIYFLIATTFSLAQEDTTFYNRDWFETEPDLASYYRIETEVQDSLWQFKDYYVKNNQLQNEGYYIPDEFETRDSTYTWYHENGSVSLQGIYDRGNRLGLWETFYENSQLKFAGKYKNDLRTGKWKWWYESGEMRSVAKYKKGHLQGKRLWWYENGKLQLEEQFNKGELDGNVISYFENGTPELKQTYEMGMPNDTAYSYYPNGQLRFKKFFKSGVEIDSLSAWYDSTGRIAEREEIEDEKANHQLLWEITGNELETPSYVFGTMHVRDPRAFEFSDTMITIFESCEATSMEIHPDSMFAFLYHSEEEDKIDNLKRLRIPNSSYGSGSYDRWYARRDYWLKDLNGLFNRPYGPPNAMPYFVDVYLFYLSKLRGKETFGLENVQEHINAGDDLPTYRKKYDILSEFDPDEEMIDVYRLGDIQKIKALMDFLTNKEFNYRLLTLRNYKMADQIDSLSNVFKSFHTCGCAHLYGKEGVLQLLRNKGYTVTAVPPNFTGSEFAADTENYHQIWHPINDDHFSVSLPGKPVTSYEDGYTKHIFMDFITKNGYSVSIIDLKNDTLEVTKKNMETIISRFTSLDYNNLSISKGKTDGRRTFEFSNKPLYTGEEHYKIILDPSTQRVIILFTGSVGELDAKEGIKNSFFNSISFHDLLQEPIEWATLTDTLSAFHIDFPIGYKSKYRVDNERSSVFYWSIDHEGSEFYTRVWDQSGRWWNRDTTSFNWSKDYYESIYGELITTDSGSFKDYPYQTWTFNPREDVFIKVRQIRRGIRTYTLTTHTNSEAHEDSKLFFSSFDFLPFKKHDWVSFSPENDSVEVKLPYEPDKKWWEGSNTYSYRHSSDYGSVLGGGLTEDEFYEGYDYNRWGSNNHRSLLTESDYSSKYEIKESYEVLDSLSGIYYQFDKKVFTEYSSYPDLDSILHEWTPEDDLDTISFRWINDGTAAKMEFDFHYQGKTLYRKMKHYYRGGHLYTLRCYYPEEVKGDSSIDYFLNSFSLHNLPDTINPFGDKKELVLEHLTSKDSLTQLRATGALDYLDFTDEDFGAIINAINTERSLDTTDIFDNTYDLFYLLNSIRTDSSSFSDSLAAYYIEFFESECDTSNKQLFVLRSLATIGTDSAYKSFAQLIPDSLGLHTYNHYRSYRYRRSSTLSRAFDDFKDSLELFVQHYDIIAPLLTKPSTERIILDLLTELYSNDEIDKTSIKGKQGFIASFAHKELAHLTTLTKDSADYRKMVNKVQDILPVLKYIDLPDSTLNIIDSLRQHKNDEIQLGANIILLLQSETNDQSKMEEVLKEHPNELELIIDLKEQDLLNLIPKKYLTQKHIALLGLTQVLKEDHYLYRKPYLEKIKLLEVYLNVQDTITTRHYIFQYYRGSSRKRFIAITGPQPEDESEINWTSHNQYIEEKYAHKEKAKKVVKSLKEKLKKGDFSGEGWEAEAFETY